MVEILLGLLSAAMTWWAIQSSRSANREQTRTQEVQATAAIVAVDAAAYQRAKEIYEGALNTLHTELESTRAEIASLRKSASDLQQSNIDLQGEVFKLRAQVVRLTLATGGLPD